MTTAQALLEKAASIMAERGKQYDSESGGERSMGRTIQAFNAITSRDLDESEGWLLMAILKMVRDNQRQSPHQDSLEDLVAYSSLYGEARLNERKL